MNESEVIIQANNQIVKPSSSDIKRFWKFVAVQPSQCWLWTGGKSEFGYGHFWVSRRTIGAHKFSWIIHNGVVPDGFCVLHNCPNGDNPSCVNPAHLWLGTTEENVADKCSKGRQSKGTTHWLVKWPEKRRFGVTHHNAILNDFKVVEIRKRRNGGESLTQIAKDFGVSLCAVSDIIHGRTWRHV